MMGVRVSLCRCLAAVALAVLGGCALRSASAAAAGQTYDPNVWLGHYTSTGCDTSACCCMNSVNIVKPVDTSVSGLWTLAGPVTGQCGTVTGFSTTLAAPASDNITYSAGQPTAQQHEARRDPTTGAVVDTDLANAQCSAVLTKTTPTGGDDASTAVTIGLYSDAACTTLVAASTQPKGACQRAQLLDDALHLKAICNDAAWSVTGHMASASTSDCSDTPVFQAASVGSEVCAPVGDAYVRVLCDGEPLTPPAAYDSSVWLGHYTASGCDPASCCCMTSANFATHGSAVTVSALVSGQCGADTARRIIMEKPTSDSHAYYTPGDGEDELVQHDARRDPTTGTITDTDLTNEQCSAVLAKTTPTGGDDSSAQVTIGVYADPLCSQLLGSSTHAKAACAPMQTAAGAVFLTATCSGQSWSAMGYATAGACTGVAEYQAVSAGSQTCAYAGSGVAGDVYVRVLCSGDSLSAASYARAAPTLLAAVGLAAMALVAVLAGQQ